MSASTTVLDITKRSLVRLDEVMSKPASRLEIAQAMEQVKNDLLEIQKVRLEEVQKFQAQYAGLFNNYMTCRSAAYSLLDSIKQALQKGHLHSSRRTLADTAAAEEKRLKTVASILSEPTESKMITIDLDNLPEKDKTPWVTPVLQTLQRTRDEVASLSESGEVVPPMLAAVLEVHTWAAVWTVVSTKLQHANDAHTQAVRDLYLPKSP